MLYEGLRTSRSKTVYINPDTNFPEIFEKRKKICPESTFFRAYPLQNAQSFAMAEKEGFVRSEKRDGIARDERHNFGIMNS